MAGKREPHHHKLHQNLAEIEPRSPWREADI